MNVGGIFLVFCFILIFIGIILWAMKFPVRNVVSFLKEPSANVFDAGTLQQYYRSVLSSSIVNPELQDKLYIKNLKMLSDEWNEANEKRVWNYIWEIEEWQWEKWKLPLVPMIKNFFDEQRRIGELNNGQEVMNFNPFPYPCPPPDVFLSDRERREVKIADDVYKGEFTCYYDDDGWLTRYEFSNEKGTWKGSPMITGLMAVLLTAKELYEEGYQFSPTRQLSQWQWRARGLKGTFANSKIEDDQEKIKEKEIDSEWLQSFANSLRNAPIEIRISYPWLYPRHAPIPKRNTCKEALLEMKAYIEIVARMEKRRKQKEKEAKAAAWEIRKKELRKFWGIEKDE